jgi:hypothetical protein
MALTFVTDVPASVSTGKRGRPALFNETLQAEVKASPGQWAVLQEGVKGRSRVSTLRKAHPSFEFRGAVTGHAERTNKKGETVTDEILTIYVQAPAPAPKQRKAAAKPAAE